MESGCSLLSGCPHFKKGDVPPEHAGETYDRSKCPHFNKDLPAAAAAETGAACPNALVGEDGGETMRCPMTGGRCECTEEKSCGCRGRTSGEEPVAPVCPHTGKSAREGSACPHAKKAEDASGGEPAVCPMSGKPASKGSACPHAKKAAAERAAAKAEDASADTGVDHDDL
jgi:hypothetical protein